MIGIVDYGVGNLASILNMCRRIGTEAGIVRTADEIVRADRLILPGVGAFDHAVSRLRGSGLLETLERRVRQDQVPVLGICLGFQLLTRSSEEGRESGLGWLHAETIHFDRTRLGSRERVPHMGWAEVQLPTESKLFLGLLAPPRFYFVHSFHVRCDSQSDIIATASHGYSFVAAAEQGNIMGVQFHPEKSHQFGMKMLQNFVERY